jgi:hypothetical protein
MKAITKLTVAVLLASCIPGHAESTRTADSLRIHSQTHLDKEVTVDVSMVKPVHWKSPLADVVFFHALTIDRTEDKSGGSILVAVDAAAAGKLSDKYGTNFDGRNDKDKLTGTFILVSGNGPSGVWMIDTTGKIAALIREKKLALPDGAKQAGDFNRALAPKRRLGRL